MDATVIRDALKSLLGIEADDTSRDAELDGYVAQAKSQIEDYLGDPLDVGEQVDTFYWPDPRVTLTAWPVASVTSVIADGEELTTDQYRLTKYGTLSAVGAGGEAGRWDSMTLIVTYQAGRANAPRWLVDAVAETAARAASRPGNGGNPIGAGQVKRESVPGVWTVEYETGRERDGDWGLIPAHIRAVLDMNRVPGHA